MNNNVNKNNKKSKISKNMIRYPKIREFRILHDLKQEFIAERLGISQPEYSRLECGFRKARLEDFKTLAKIYDVHINILMVRDQESVYDRPKKRPISPSILADEQIMSLLDQHAQILSFLKQSNIESQQIIQKLIPFQPTNLQSPSSNL
jgi:transcriptional regulator with XRE-family HTH domain